MADAKNAAVAELVHLPVNEKFGKLASDQQIEAAVQALDAHGIKAMVFENGNQAKEQVLKMIPEGAQVFTSTSKTLESLGISEAINASGKYDSVRNALNKMDRKTQSREMAALGAAPEWLVGSVHAATEDGALMIASATGSQLSPAAHAADKVVYVVSTKKIVKDQEEGLQRIKEYSYPLEDVRAQIAYGGMRSSVSKILVIRQERTPDRITVLFVKEDLGF